MSIIEDLAIERKRELEAATQTLDNLKKMRDELIHKSREMGSNVTRGDIVAIRDEIAVQMDVVTKSCKDFAAAVVALEAENKLEEEMRNTMQGLGR